MDNTNNINGETLNLKVWKKNEYNDDAVQLPTILSHLNSKQ